jgi:hypothetical protein
MNIQNLSELRNEGSRGGQKAKVDVTKKSFEVGNGDW